MGANVGFPSLRISHYRLANNQNRLCRCVVKREFSFDQISRRLLADSVKYPFIISGYWKIYRFLTRGLLYSFDIRLENVNYN